MSMKNNTIKNFFLFDKPKKKKIKIKILALNILPCPEYFRKNNARRCHIVFLVMLTQKHKNVFQYVFMIFQKIKWE
jgi:hypothetical protein